MLGKRWRTLTEEERATYRDRAVAWMLPEEPSPGMPPAEPIDSSEQLRAKGSVK
jgi:hypothetical protein